MPLSAFELSFDLDLPLTLDLQVLLLSRCQGCRRSIEAAVEVSRLLSKCQGCCRGVEAAVEVPRLLSRCEAAVEVSKPPPSCRIYQGAPRLLSKCQGQVDVAIRWESSSNCDTGYTSSAINIYKAFTSKKRACRVGGVKDSEFGSKGYVRFRRRP
jgi:hypothetical protein